MPYIVVAGGGESNVEEKTSRPVVSYLALDPTDGGRLVTDTSNHSITVSFIPLASPTDHFAVD